MSLFSLRFFFFFVKNYIFSLMILYHCVFQFFGYAQLTTAVKLVPPKPYARKRFLVKTALVRTFSIVNRK